MTERKMIYLDDAIDVLNVLSHEHRYKIPGERETYSQYNEAWQDALGRAKTAIENLPSAQPDCEKYEYHTDHTDCIYYHTGQAISSCPQYRDGWNDAMNYIFKNGKGYSPYRRVSWE